MVQPSKLYTERGVDFYHADDWQHAGFLAPNSEAEVVEALSDERGWGVVIKVEGTEYNVRGVDIDMGRAEVS